MTKTIIAHSVRVQDAGHRTQGHAILKQLYKILSYHSTPDSLQKCISEVLIQLAHSNQRQSKLNSAMVHL